MSRSCNFAFPYVGVSRIRFKGTLSILFQNTPKAKQMYKNYHTGQKTFPVILSFHEFLYLLSIKIRFRCIDF